MADNVTDLTEFELPYRRKAILRKVEFESGMFMVRLILKEGNRITQVDLDSTAAITLGEALVSAATRE
ncbi:DUF6967 family protein [Aliiruegeria lutimaris]|uniref:Uncharacterized protein n=1 Tax=Aliiruegeria lutimaris TaxID=571298 RepID=A0A1G8S7Q9_9RHOB|nr:hypothetical protein [Aliiruegeria lutimaris]SDJ25201.1 hypothetical protein SAMN04488026_101477 [Aliiruegeria lutimaris]